MTRSEGPRHVPASVPQRSGAVPFEPVTLAEVKTQLKIAQAINRHDNELGRLIVEAREFVEPDLGRVAATGSFVWSLPWFPAEAIVLPYRNTTGIEELKYTNSSGEEVVMAEADYQFLSPATIPTLWPAAGQMWPDTQAGNVMAVVLTFTAGYAAIENVPEKFKQAVLARISWVWSREDQRAGAMTAYESIVQSERLVYP